MAANQGNGDCISTFSTLTLAHEAIDVVLVPPPPPGKPELFKNTAHLADALDVAPTVFINDKPAVLKKSHIPTSEGASAAATIGATSKLPKNGECTFLLAATTITITGSPAIRHRDMTQQNSKNTIGGVKIKNAFCLADSGMVLDPNMDPKQQEAYVEQLEKLYERPRSRELLDTIRSEYAGRVASGARPNIITLSDRDPAGNIISAGAAQQNAVVGAGQVIADEYTPGLGLDSLVSTQPGEVVNQPGYGDIQPDILLAHELVHAIATARGTTLAGTTMGIGASQATNNFELQAMGIGSESDSRLAESRFLEERGAKVRTSHGGPEGKHKFNPKKESVAPVAYSTGPNGEHFVYFNK